MAVAFPDYSIDVFLKAGEAPRERTSHDRTLGRRIRFFGSKPSLRGLLASPEMQFAMRSDALERTNITDVTLITPRGHVAFRRERQAERASIGFALRSEERFLARAEARGQSVTGTMLRERTAAILNRVDEALPFLSLNSTSTGQTFGMHIARDEAKFSQFGDIDTYGFSRRCDATGVPVEPRVMPVF